jgi:hypothetical protein
MTATLQSRIANLQRDILNGSEEEVRRGFNELRTFVIFFRHNAGFTLRLPGNMGQAVAPPFPVPGITNLVNDIGEMLRVQLGVPPQPQGQAQPPRP